MSNRRLFKFLDIFSYILLILNVFFIPLVMDKNLVDFHIIPKQYLFMGLVLMNVLLFALKIVLTKRLSYRQSILDFFVLALLGLMLLSSIFSANIYDSFLGRSEYFVLHFVFLSALAVFYFVLVNYLQRPGWWRGMTDALLLVGGTTGVLFCLKTLFHYDFLSSWFGLTVWNTIEKINSPFGLWMLVIFILAAGQLIKKDLPAGRSLVVFFISIISITSLVLLGFEVIWWMLVIAIVFLLILGVNFVKEARMGWLSVLFAMLVLTIILIIFGTPKQLQSVVPAEVALGSNPSWKIVGSTVFSGVKNFMLGSGAGTFNVDFSRFRDEAFNYDSTAWMLRFGQPYNTLQAFVSENGLLFTLLFVFIILYVLGHVFQVWYHSRDQGIPESAGFGLGLRQDNIRLEIFLTALAWLVLSIGMCFIFFGPALWWLWWLLLGLVVTGLAFLYKGIIKDREWTVEDTPQYSLSFSFILIVIISAVIMAGVWGARLYSGELLYAQALQSNDYKVAEDKLVRAIGQRPNTDIYHSALAQVYLYQATDMTKVAQPDVPAISVLVAKAVNEAKRATEISPNTVMIWENLAVMYENASALVPEARDWAIKTWQTAKDLEPTNAVLYWRLANNYALAGKWEDAIKNYKEAIRLKSDYLGAHTGLANAYEQTNQPERAVEVYKSILPAGAGNVEILFNYGRLLYNRNKGADRGEAEKLWLEAARLSPNYSNVLYSLGLLYELRGERSAALEYYYKVKDLNPNNQDITNKIRLLVGGR